ncbi:MAG: 50S ribosomal protein L28 [Gammaproteobacteria bacterium]|nr:50S ribosomal protein L28 [Pseudomonadota bacterium]MCH9662439.1 50S ribosomal protein L28 [Gammaproteobacteria bacterium]
MTRECFLTGKKTASGNRVSHANNKTKRRFYPNLHWHRLWLPSEGRFVRLRLCSKALRTIDKLGIDQVVRDIRRRGLKV